MAELDPEVAKRLPKHIVWALEQLRELKQEQEARRRKRWRRGSGAALGARQKTSARGGTVAFAAWI